MSNAMYVLASASLVVAIGATAQIASVPLAINGQPSSTGLGRTLTRKTSETLPLRDEKSRIVYSFMSLSGDNLRAALAGHYISLDRSEPATETEFYEGFMVDGRWIRTVMSAAMLTSRGHWYIKKSKLCVFYVPRGQETGREDCRIIQIARSRDAAKIRSFEGSDVFLYKLAPLRK